MASFVIHTIVGERFLNELETKYNVSISEEERLEFLLGNLIVDSVRENSILPEGLTEEEQVEFLYQRRRRVQEEKVKTHFRDPNKLNLCLRVPEDEWFVNKYSKLLTYDYSTLGYLFHLYTDRLFFGDLFKATFISLDKNGQETIYDKEATTIEVIKNKRRENKKDFWTGQTELSIYNDYTIMNKMLLAYYGTSFDESRLLEFAKEHFKNPGIEEVDYSLIIDVIRKTSAFIKESYQVSETELSVFDEEVLKKFIESIPSLFIDKYDYIVSNYGTPIERGNKMIFASNNKGKIREIKSIFNEEEIISLSEANIDIDVIEDENSFYGNALKKAKEIYELTKVPVIADDSGICIEAFEGWPGVLTHRFAGETSTDEERNQIMVDKTSQVDNKKAQVVCNLVYYDGTNIIVGEGILKGTIVPPRGTNGFGFDPIFELDTGKTLAELTSEEKNITSARYLAALDLHKKLSTKKCKTKTQ